jgi:hypothetical protein
MPNIPTFMGSDTSGQAALLGYGKGLPFVSGVRSVFFLGSNAEQSRINARRNGARATVVGNPDWKNGYATLLGLSDFLRTADIDDKPDLTLMAAMRATPGVQADGSNATKFVGIGNYRTTGAMLWTQSNADYAALAVAGTSTYDNGAGGNIIKHTYVKTGNVDVTQWALYAFVREAGVGRRAYDLTRGTSQIVADTAAPVRNTADAFCIGSALALYTGPVDVAVALNGSIPFTTTQMGKFADYFRAYSGRRGITF